MHPRCLNCHGGVDPFTAKNHPGAPVPRVAERPSAGCQSCHDAATVRVPTGQGFTEPAAVIQGSWFIPRPERWFAGRSDKEICLQMLDAFPGLPADPSDFFQHVDHDERIRLGFEGNRGLRTTEGHPIKPLPPPMSHEEFGKLAREWTTVGHAECGVEAR